MTEENRLALELRVHVDSSVAHNARRQLAKEFAMQALKFKQEPCNYVLQNREEFESDTALRRF